MTLEEKTEWTQTRIEENYRSAFALYQEKAYQRATEMFKLLVLARPFEAKYWKALGACLQMQKAYEEALSCYSSALAFSSKPIDLSLYVYAADCYFALKQIEAGLKTLETASLYAKEGQEARLLHHLGFMREQWSPYVRLKVV